jgi:hypothetical protein
MHVKFALSALNFLQETREIFACSSHKFRKILTLSPRLSSLGSVKFCEFVSTRRDGWMHGKIKAMVARWVEVFEIVGSM